jgi:ABC-type sugar transport system ATPase subunit
MPDIHLERVSKRFSGTQAALHDVSLEVREREVLTVVGPSGCGKSTLLRLIAGLEALTSGDIRIDGISVKAIPARNRDVAMVFQSYALYPHMTCYDNLALNLRLKKMPAAELDHRVQETAAMLGISELLDKRPRQLSGGQRQRVALGRALTRKPGVLLLDEPLSNLDALLRERVRHDLRRLFRQVQATVVYVTHDQTEAMSLADRVLVLDRGSIQQIGAPELLYRMPANRFVASFIGSPSMNFFDAVVDGGSVRLGNGGVHLPVDRAGTVTVGIRPEAIQQGGPLSATVCWIEALGANFLAGLDFGNATLTALLNSRPSRQTIEVSVNPDHVHAFDIETGKNLRADRP